MNNELFGVFGDRRAFERLRSPAAFDRVVEGPSLTFGVRDDGLDVPGRTQVETRDEACCVVWGEAHLPVDDSNPASWLLDQYPYRGLDAFSSLNGSFLAVVDDGHEPMVVTDPLRTRECFYTDAAGERAFGTDPSALTALLGDQRTSRQSLLEFVHMGVVLGDRTLFEELSRVPFDGYLQPDATGELERFVYDPQEFNYVESLAHRLRHAIARRRDQPGRTGVLLSAGYDSRLFLSELDDLDRCYTVGHPESDEVAVSRTLATQHGVEHRVLDPRRGYLNTDPETVQYGQAVKESLQVHHTIDDETMQLDSVHHGLLFDTLLAGYFLPQRTLDAFGQSLPLRGLEPDPDVAETLLFDNFGFYRVSNLPGFDAGAVPEDSVAFCRDAIESQRDRLSDRFDSTYDAISAVGIQNQPTLPFHTHLADNYFATFVAADMELIKWHLHTPPEHRNKRTYRRALETLDSSLLSPRPHDRPHSTYAFNQIEKFLRRQLPGVKAFETAWPDLEAHYEQSDLHERTVGPDSDLRDLPARLKLRLHDAACWSDSIADDTPPDPVHVVSAQR